MKKFLVVLFVLVVLSIVVSCEPPVTNAAKDTITFKLNGATVTLTKGFIANGGVPSFCEVADGGPLLVYLGSDVEIDASEPNAYMVIYYPGDAAGDFTDVYFEYNNNSAGLHVLGNVSGTLDSQGDVGTYSTGTFSGAGFDGLNTYTITGGKFNIVRSPDNSIDL
ncbi:MAG: hypothetical protein JW904_11770 [Spirochaetales bacterium]|nr:hypothetical protein [Spirochaetales bacterium]